MKSLNHEESSADRKAFIVLGEIRFCAPEGDRCSAMSLRVSPHMQLQIMTGPHPMEMFVKIIKYNSATFCILIS